MALTIEMTTHQGSVRPVQVDEDLVQSKRRGKHGKATWAVRGVYRDGQGRVRLVLWDHYRGWRRDADPDRYVIVERGE